MGSVVSVPQWNTVKNVKNIGEKFCSCDKFIRSKIVPPPIGSAVFTFRGGRVTLTGDTTTIMGDECEVVVRGNFVAINGLDEQADQMFCAIHREIEEIRGTTKNDF